jgi:two-component system LytT family response regulator
MTIRTLIVDDEPVARRRLRRLLRSAADVDIIGECADGAAAVESVRVLGPDLVLLDVQMPELDGFGVLQNLASPEPGQTRREQMPDVIFVTAHDRYAVRAFEVHALDYLLKPVDADRLGKALDRARGRLLERQRVPVDPRLLALLQDLAAERRYLTRIPVKADGRILVVDLAEVDWIGAADNYVVLHAGPREHLLRDTMGRLERELDPERFVRIHRSAIVQIDRVRELVSDFHGDFEVALRDGTRLTLSRSYRAKVEAALGREI